MGDMGEAFREMREATRDKHRQWHEKNRRVLAGSGYVYQDRGETLLFRTLGRPKVDFYPSTGRWRIVGDPKEKRTFSGGAKKFLKWYAKQGVEVEVRR